MSRLKEYEMANNIIVIGMQVTFPLDTRETVAHYLR